ncbi:nucleoside 2-deoxyribosyltransferase domain-containing protein [Glycomyces rhizosphaerae]|uniref:Nucleoside 2-deoxyribosyltransferase domain-containing protein n=1 Tax=Glycomyces rhizosphaerae TaxID=2054422 RepID=A0ABV7PYZ1_9ACTN
MASEVVVVHANETPPDSWDAAVFLAGPLPRSAEVPAWNREAVALLRERWRQEGRLVVFTPELREGVLADYTGQVEWEHRWLHAADVILFWVPRDLDTMPAFTTNIEWGAWYDSGKVVFGAPVGAPKNEYLLHLAASSGVPVADTLGGAADAALAMVDAGSRRAGGERSVPLLVWRTDSFQSWYGAQRAAGNRLVGARVEWTFRVGPGREAVHYWAAQVQVHVAAEDRVKSNEVVISRPDTAQVLLYRPGPSPEATIVVLVREFRSPASTADGFVHELPGGSGDEPDVAVQALEEVREETGLRLGIDRMRFVGARQVAATVSAHRSHLFAAELTADELDWLRAHQGTANGVGETERTWVEITTFGDMLDGALVDWSTLGMVARALNRPNAA